MKVAPSTSSDGGAQAQAKTKAQGQTIAQPRAEGEALEEPPPMRSIVFDGSMSVEAYDDLHRPWADNGITTSKYTWYNFLPLNLFEQFRKAANLYFLVMVILMIVGQSGVLFRSSLTYISTLAPLVMVMGFTMVMEIKDDCFRHKQDRLINLERMASVVAGGEVKHVRWKDVRVGQLVLVRDKEEIPADLVLLSSNKMEGICYVETSNIDGETNLKLKLAVPRLYQLVSQGHEGSLATAVTKASQLAGTMAFEGPNSSIRTFSGSIEGPRLVSPDSPPPPPSGGGGGGGGAAKGGTFDECAPGSRTASSEDVCGVGPSNLLLRGSKIRNTAWVLGLVAYTGEETKVMMNSRATRTKLSSINRTVNYMLLVVFGAMVLLTTISVIVTHFFREQQGWDGSAFQGLWYINNPDIVGYGTASSTVLLSGPYLSWLGDFFTYFVLYNNFIPISLYVTLEICNFCQALWINNDFEMFYAPSRTPALVRSSALSQELGQIEYVFSDKTGTLTRNEMKLKKFVVCATSEEYACVPESRDKIAAVLNGSQASPQTMVEGGNDLDDLANGAKDLRSMLTIMSVAHTVVIEEERLHLKGGNATSPPARSESKSGGNINSAAAEDPVDNVPDTSVANDTLVYNAESPDEGALVDAARTLGFTFRERNFDSVSIEVPTAHDLSSRSSSPASVGPDSDAESETDLLLASDDMKASTARPVEKYTILAINQFSSTRKRMSVLVQAANGRFLLLAKGADNVMVDIAAGGQQKNIERLQAKLHGYACEGLRTLVFGFAYIDAARCTEWLKLYQTASNAIQDRKKLLAQAASEIEQGIRIVGATAIEDKLQTGVPGAVSDLQRAGIKLWVLTGDKMETAINIGFSSHVLTPEMVILQIDEHRNLNSLAQRARLRKQFTAIAKKIEAGAAGIGADAATAAAAPGRKRLTVVSKSPHVAPAPTASKSGGDQQKAGAPEIGLVVSGPALSHVLDDDDLKARFLQLGRKCKVVIACRVSPLQKAQIVRLVRYNIEPQPITLAIGDGANDVGMIQEAHVGVGISGKEGLQAVNNSDFAIAQFAYLRRLLLVHGRWNYRRVCKVILYSFYKNVAFVFVAFFYNFFSGWSGMSLYEGLMGSQFNLILALPIIATGVFDKDVGAATILKHPGLYISGRFNLDLNVAQMVKTLCLAIFHGGIVFGIPCVMFYGNVSSATTLPVFGMTVMTCLIITMQYRVFFLTATWNWLTWVCWVGSFLLYIAFLFSYSNMPEIGYRSFKATEEMAINPLFWVVAAGVPLCAMVLDVFVEYLRREFYPNPIDITLELEGLLKDGRKKAGVAGGKLSNGSNRGRGGSRKKRGSSSSSSSSSGGGGGGSSNHKELQVASLHSRDAILNSFTNQIATLAEDKQRRKARKLRPQLSSIEEPALQGGVALSPSAADLTVISAHGRRDGFIFSSIDTDSSSDDDDGEHGTGDRNTTSSSLGTVGNEDLESRGGVGGSSSDEDGPRLPQRRDSAPERLARSDSGRHSTTPRLATRMASARSFRHSDTVSTENNPDTGRDEEPQGENGAGSLQKNSNGTARKTLGSSGRGRSSMLVDSLTAVGNESREVGRKKGGPVRGLTRVELPPQHTSSEFTRGKSNNISSALEQQQQQRDAQTGSPTSGSASGDARSKRGHAFCDGGGGSVSGAAGKGGHGKGDDTDPMHRPGGIKKKIVVDKKKTARDSVNRHLICQQALPVWQPPYQAMRYFAITLLSSAVFAIFGTVLVVANDRYVEYYVQYDGPPHNPFRNSFFDGYRHEDIAPFEWNITQDPSPGQMEALKTQWAVDDTYSRHFYSYQPCQLHGVLKNSHSASKTCQVAIYMTDPIEAQAVLNYRLSNFYYSFLQFALSWNPYQLMANDDFVYSFDDDDDSDGGLGPNQTTRYIAEDQEKVAAEVQMSTGDGSCANAVYNNRTGMLLEPCGLRVAAMFNDKFRLINYTRPQGGAAHDAVSLNESNIAWSSDGTIFKNSREVDEGKFLPNVAYLHQQQPHIVNASEGIRNEHFRVWMHSEAFPAFNKRYAHVEGTLARGTTLIFEVDAHFPTMQFGGAKYLHLAAVDPLQVKNKFTPYVFVGAAGVCFVLAVFILIEKLACARPRGQAKFNKQWYIKSLQSYERRHEMRTSATIRPTSNDSIVSVQDDDAGLDGSAGSKAHRGPHSSKVAPLRTIVTSSSSGQSTSSEDVGGSQ